MRRNLRRVWQLLSWALTLSALVGWALFLRPQSMGGDASYVVIRGNSMLPTYQNGDLVIVRSAPSYEIGDPVAYRVPDGELGAGTLVIHRVIGGDAESGFVLQGDNNEGLDPWFPRAADVVGRTYLHLPVVGRVTALMHQPITLGGLAAGLMVMWVVSRPSARKGQAPASEEDGVPSSDRPARLRFPSFPRVARTRRWRAVSRRLRRVAASVAQSPS